MLAEEGVICLWNKLPREYFKNMGYSLWCVKSQIKIQIKLWWIMNRSMKADTTERGQNGICTLRAEGRLCSDHHQP